MHLKNVAVSEFKDVVSFSEHVGNVSQTKLCQITALDSQLEVITKRERSGNPCS